MSTFSTVLLFSFCRVRQRRPGTNYQFEFELGKEKFTLTEKHICFGVESVKAACRVSSAANSSVRAMEASLEARPGTNYQFEFELGKEKFTLTEKHICFGVESVKAACRVSEELAAEETLQAAFTDSTPKQICFSVKVNFSLPNSNSNW